MKQKLLTIVTPNLNGGEFLEDTIKSVLLILDAFLTTALIPDPVKPTFPNSNKSPAA